jgi:peptide/nickel transport system substrate-binding protein
MNGRELVGAVTTFFLFVLISVIILLQILLMVQSDRLYERLNRLQEILESTAHTHAGKGTSDVANTPASAYDANEGDWLVWAFRVEPKTLNPISAEADTYTTWVTIPYIFEPLLTHDFDTAKLKPLLAKGYKVSGDGLDIDFHLRDNVRFSDGSALNAEDVVFTYETAMNPEVGAAGLASTFDVVSRVTKVDSHTVRFHLKRPCFESLENLPFAWSVGLLPKHIYEFSDATDFDKRISNPVGTGPYMLEKWDVGRQIVLKRNEKYWARTSTELSRTSKPKLKKIVYRFISNPVASVQALRCHEVDMVIPEPEQFADLVNDENFRKNFHCLSYWTAWTPFFYIGWNQDTPFFSDKRVRLAMTHIVGRQQIITHLLQGYGREITGPFCNLGPKNDPTIEPWPYDPQKASQLLDAAGWRDTNGDGVRDKNGLRFRFNLAYSNSYALYERLAKLLKDEAAKIGVEVIPQPCEWSILLARLNDRRVEAYVAGWGGDKVSDPYPLFHSSQIGQGSNYVGFSNSQADVLLEQARRTISNDKRNELYRRLHRVLHEEQPYTFLFTRPTFRLIDRRFRNVTVHKLGLNYRQWYVPESEQRYK